MPKSNAMLKNRTHVYLHPVLPGMSMLQAAYVKQQFAKHRHETYSIGVIVSGVNRFMHRGSHHYATSGTLCVVNPDEVHTGETCTEQGWQYFNISPSAQLFMDAQLALGIPQSSVYFPTSVIDDKHAAKALHSLALNIGQAAGALAVEQCWLELCQLLFARHVELTKEPNNRAVMPRIISKAREVLDSNLNTNLSLTELAKICDVSPFHLARSFTTHVGIPPHAYHVQKRIEYAKTLIQQGVALVEAASKAGFADQAHLTRHFRRHLGAVPGQFKMK
jgi:AraC-like DNA-binding protein